MCLVTPKFEEPEPKFEFYPLYIVASTPITAAENMDCKRPLSDNQ